MSTVTIEQIAKVCNVSRGTVDRVIHNRPNVSDEKRKKVLKALKELNYVPNPVARALALQDNKIKVAVILPNWGGFFHTEVSRGIESAITEFSDYSLDIEVHKCKTDDPEEHISIIDNVLSNGIKGISICAKNSELLREKLKSIRQDNIPIITFNSDIPDSNRNCFVGEDVLKGGRVAGEIINKLTNKKDQVLVTCGNREFYAHKKRVEGFTKKFIEVKRKNDILPIIQTYNQYKNTYNSIKKVLLNNPNIQAIYMANESVEACVDVVNEVFSGTKNKKPHIVCHDLTKHTKKYLKRGNVDFVIEQNMFKQGYEPISILESILIARKTIENELRYTPIHIINAENM